MMATATATPLAPAPANAPTPPPVMTLAGSEGWIDVMDRVAGVGEFATVRAASSAARWDDVRFFVIGLDALIAAKRAAARRKDQEALLELEALREERRKRGL